MDQVTHITLWFRKIIILMTFINFPIHSYRECMNYLYRMNPLMY